MFNFAYGPVPDIVLEPGFLERLREAFPTGEPIAGIPGGAGAEQMPKETLEGMDAYGNIHFTNKEPTILRPPLPGDPGYDPTLPPDYLEPVPFPIDIMPMGKDDKETSIAKGIAALMPAVEEEKYKKYVASDTNPFESMGVSSLGQDALRQMIFERANPSVNQQKNYKSYIG